MERQEEYDLRQNISNQISKDVEKSVESVYEKLKGNFTAKYIFPLAVLEKKFRDMSDQSFYMGLDATNELLLTVNPLREAVYWFVLEELKRDKKIKYKNSHCSINESDEKAFINNIMQLYDLHCRGEQIKEIRDCSSKVLFEDLGDNEYGLLFPTISEKYSKEMLYYYGLDDRQKAKEEEELVARCEMYLMEKTDVTKLPSDPLRIHKYINLLDGMNNSIDVEYFELCKQRVLKDLNKISYSSLESTDDRTGRKVINSKDELATFLALIYYLTRVFVQNNILKEHIPNNNVELVCQFQKSKILALGKQVELSSDAINSYVEYFSIDTSVKGGGFTEFPFLTFRDNIMWIPSSFVLNDFQFSIVNGHYFKNIRFDNKNDTVSQSIVEYIVQHAKKYSNILYSTEYDYAVQNESFNGKPLVSDIDVALYDKVYKKLLIIECKWKENVYNVRENYVRIEDAFKKIFDNQLDKHRYYLEGDKSRLTELFDGIINFEEQEDVDVLYLFVDKRIQYHDNKNNRHAMSIFMLAHLFEKYGANGELNLGEVFEDIRGMESELIYERVKLKKSVQVGEYLIS